MVEIEGKETRPFTPDVRVVTPSGEQEGRQGAVLVAEPVLGEDEMEMEAIVTDEFHEKFIEIHDLADDQILVTSIEVLSPSNKRRGTEGWRRFLCKRQASLKGKINLIEIDLLRGGTRMPMRQAWPACPYVFLGCRGETAPRCRVTQGHYRQRLPVLKVPLRTPDADVDLDLQPMIDDVYSRSRYRQRLDYNKPLDPPLPPPDVAWLAEALKTLEPSA